MTATTTAAPLDRMDIDGSAEALLTDALRPVVWNLIRFLGCEAEKYPTALRRFEVRGYTSPEEGTEQIIVRQWVKLPPLEALAYWDHLETPVEEWIATLPPADADLLAQRVTIEVRGTEDAV